MYPPWIGNQDKSGIEFPDLIEHEIPDDEPNEVALVILYILFALQVFSEFIVKKTHANRENKHILIEVLV